MEEIFSFSELIIDIKTNNRKIVFVCDIEERILSCNNIEQLSKIIQRCQLITRDLFHVFKLLLEHNLEMSITFLLYHKSIIDHIGFIITINRHRMKKEIIKELIKEELINEEDYIIVNGNIYKKIDTLIKLS